MPTPPKTPPKPPFELHPSDFDIRDPLTREAVAWLVHLNSGTAQAEDWTSFEAWQESSGEHQRAAQRARQIWEQVGPSLLAHRKSRFPKIPVIVAAAIGLAAAAFAGGAFGPPASFFADYKSSTGEVRTVHLRDGSEVDLDTGTSFDVSDGDRTITLYTGQVFVRVSPGQARSFTVIAGDAHAQALGTAFSVRLDSDRATVLVAESKVRVSDEGRRKGAEVVSAGSAVTLSSSEGLGRPQAADVDTLTAWRRGALVFTQRPLGEVAREIGRYRGGKIVVLNSSIRDLPITGNVVIGNVDDFLGSLPFIAPVRVIRLPGLVTITAR